MLFVNKRHANTELIMPLYEFHGYTCYLSIIA